jgi:hypothetical protein
MILNYKYIDDSVPALRAPLPALNRPRPRGHSRYRATWDLLRYLSAEGLCRERYVCAIVYQAEFVLRRVLSTQHSLCACVASQQSPVPAMHLQASLFVRRMRRSHVSRGKYTTGRARARFWTARRAIPLRSAGRGAQPIHNRTAK